jgi:hypothetical protein
MHTSTKPAIFISSTIYDFRDLRSALKFWLEQLGYEVMLSEFNDFTKPLDENSYTACLKAIERANYFILLIGARTGGLFDASKKVSITRMEYRTAYDLVKAGKMKLITFVREDLWNVREDRKALKSLLTKTYAAEKELSEADVEEITKHSSAFLNDAEATFSFLHEVARIDEMKQAIVGQTSLPIGNWIHPFSTFQDIVETLSAVLNTKRNLSTIAMITNLKREILSNLTQLTSKEKDNKISFKTSWGDAARRSYKGGLSDSSTMPARHLCWLGFYLLFKSSASRLSMQFIDQALSSGTFLEYDFQTSNFKSTPIHDALFQLKENIGMLRGFSEGTLNDEQLKFIAKYSHASNRKAFTDESVTVKNEELLMPLVCHDCEQNIAMLCIAIFKAIDGDAQPLINLKLNALNPSQEEVEKVKEERTTIEDIVAWLEKSASE